MQGFAVCRGLTTPVDGLFFGKAFRNECGLIRMERLGRESPTALGRAGEPGA
jgi:hypothetical protein